MITHLSYPEGRGINDFIDPDLCTVFITNLKKKQFINIWQLFEFSSPAKIKSSK
jgi:hypothetical protein